MASGYLYAWDATNEVWVKVQVNSDGELILVTS